VTTHSTKGFPVIIELMAESIWSQEELAVFRANAVYLRIKDQEMETRRRETAWVAAHAAADLLRQDFHASRVVAFGSLVRDGSFTRWSDVDIAAWGIDSKDTLRAIGAVMDMEMGIDVNLVDVATATPALMESIMSEGVEL